MDLQAYLQHCQTSLDPQTSLPGQAFKGPGYHSTVEQGTWVHHTRESMDYALALLISDDPQVPNRVPKIINQVLDQQETNPTKQTFGIWPWLFEESLDEMSPPDWNWADFIGVRIAQMLKCHSDKLPDELITRMKTALDHAAWSIFRRNMHAGYTNIAVMGAGCTAAAGELLKEERLLKYAQIRLQNVVDHVADNGSFVEYNSPNYSIVLLEELSRIFVFCEDPLIRALSHELLDKAWQVVGEHYHPPTHQWAGPHARCYQQLLPPLAAQIISEGIGSRVPLHPLNHDATQAMAAMVPTQPCPQEHLSLFLQDKISCPISVRRQFVKQHNRIQTGTTWMNDTATLGSINIEDTWNQRRPVLAYWKTPSDPAVAMRVRMLHDDYDFSSGMIRTQQQDHRILMAWNLLNDRGDTHISLDRTEKPIFTFSELSVQWELVGIDVSVEAIDEHRFELIAGDYRAVLHTGFASFNGKPVTWECGKMERGVTVKAICHSGDPLTVDLRDITDFKLACALEIIPLDQNASLEKLSIEPVNETGYIVQWQDLSVQVPVVCQAYLD
ncbi:MAG TPA: hypothetical protein DER01_03965 [Phycisphaerales bacterium]|nr:hypothetical protein [Phycisphaerales bacterium]